MTKKRIDPDELFPSRQYGFSQIVVSQGSKTVYFSGQVAWDAREQIVGPNDFRAQTFQAMRNVETAVKAAGGSLTDIVSMRIYIVTDKLAQSSAVSEALLSFFPEDQLPTTTWIGVPALANEGFLIEIEPIAVLGETE